MQVASLNNAEALRSLHTRSYQAEEALCRIYPTCQPDQRVISRTLMLRGKLTSHRPQYSVHSTGWPLAGRRYRKGEKMLRISGSTELMPQNGLYLLEPTLDKKSLAKDEHIDHPLQETGKSSCDILDVCRT